MTIEGEVKELRESVSKQLEGLAESKPPIFLQAIIMPGDDLNTGRIRISASPAIGAPLLQALLESWGYNAEWRDLDWVSILPGEAKEACDGADQG